jgi:hypothetical protein
VPTPIEYQAIRNAQAALQAIAIASGYFFDVVDAAVKLDPDQAAEALVRPDGSRPFILIEMRDEVWQYDQANELRLTLPFTLHWVSDAPPAVDESRLEMFYQACADVEKALAVDISRGGVASDTRITKRRMDMPPGTRVWALIDAEIWLRRQYGQPNG